MAWVVDSCVMLDVALNDPAHGHTSATLLQQRLGEGLSISPVTYIELTPQFGGQTAEVDTFLRIAGVACSDDWTTEDRLAAAVAFHRYVELKRRAKVRKRPIADILIGAYALRFKGLITRNPSDFASIFPELKILEP